MQSLSERFHFLIVFVGFFEVVVEIAGVNAIRGNAAFQDARDLIKRSAFGFGDPNEDEQTNRRHHDQERNESVRQQGGCWGGRGEETRCEL